MPSNLRTGNVISYFVSNKHLIIRVTNDRETKRHLGPSAGILVEPTTGGDDMRSHYPHGTSYS